MPSVESARGIGAPPLSRATDETRRDAPQMPDGDEIRAFPTRACVPRRDSTAAGCWALALPVPAFLRRLCEVRRTASAKSSEIGRNHTKSTLSDRFEKSVLRVGGVPAGFACIADVLASVREAAWLRIVEFWPRLCPAAAVEGRESLRRARVGDRRARGCWASRFNARECGLTARPKVYLFRRQRCSETGVEKLPNF